MTLDPVSGVISGSPTEFGDFTINIYATDAASGSKSRTYSLHVDESAYIPGDINLDLAVNPVDVVLLVNYVYKQGQVPAVLNSADVNGDCAVNPVDVVTMVNFVYKQIGTLLYGCVE